MELLDHVGVPSLLFRSILDDTRMVASVLVRATFDIVGDSCVLAEEQPWIASSAPWNGPCGPMDSDEVFYRGGVDLFVFGSARPPGGSKATAMEVRIAVGGFERRLLVFGDRTWRQIGRGLVASAPEPFDELPLTLGRAFGGKDTWDGLEVPFPANPDGRGYYLQASGAVDRPLPNIEDPAHRVAHWDDRPSPAGVGLRPPFGGMRVEHGLRLSTEGRIEEVLPTFFNAACPGMIAPSVDPGAALRIEGVTPAGPLVFELPSARPRVRLCFGDVTIERALQIDQVGVVVDARQVFVSYRYPFRYVVHREQERRCEVSWAVAPRSRR